MLKDMWEQSETVEEHLPAWKVSYLPLWSNLMVQYARLSSDSSEQSMFRTPIL